MTGPRIAVDAMGGDFAPREVIAGAVAAARDTGVSVILVGPADQVSAEAHRVAQGRLPDSLSIFDTPDFIAMDAAPREALRRMPRASVKVAAELVSRGEADGFYSLGHTGATVLAAHAAFGMLEGAERPAIAVLVPTLAGSAVLLDTGATLDCRPVHLQSFGVMGAAYSTIALGIERPRVGLLSVGEEAGKGTELVREAHGLLAASGLNFVGNLEARDFFSGRADVIVCDGFTGNVALKVGEGLVDAMEELLKKELAKSLAARVGGRSPGPRSCASVTARIRRSMVARPCWGSRGSRWSGMGGQTPARCATASRPRRDWSRGSWCCGYATRWRVHERIARPCIRVVK